MERVVAVTGGASGIGLAVAQAALAEGWRVAVADRDAAGLEKTGAALAAGDRARFTTLDVTEEGAVEAWIAAAAAMGPLKGLVTSAGIAREVPVFDTTVDLFRQVLDINVTGTFLCARAAARVMKEGGGGAILTVGSVSGLRGGKGRVAYGASKGAVINMTRVLATDLARFGIRANCLCPGPVETPLVAALTDAKGRRGWERRIPMRRFAGAEEVAAMALVLLDPARSGFVNGQAVAVDGGFTSAGIMDEED
jgi:NAD(P)-dependent dehydrogenase (short-subunit alcohol dehydrogenase family)